LATLIVGTVLAFLHPAGLVLAVPALLLYARRMLRIWRVRHAPTGWRPVKGHRPPATDAERAALDVWRTGRGGQAMRVLHAAGYDHARRAEVLRHVLDVANDDDVAHFADDAQVAPRPAQLVPQPPPPF